MEKFKKTSIEGLFVCNNFVAEDQRGVFVKIFNSEDFKEIGCTENFKESYYSVSTKDVIRGMHFQIPPHDHFKLVTVISGNIIDVVVDLRKTSSSFGKYEVFQLSSNNQSVFIPKGCAHGFLTVSESATVLYYVSTTYNKKADSGILWNSIGYDWPVLNPVISERDMSFPGLSLLCSYF